MNDREHALELLSVVERELRALRGMLDAQAFSDEVFGFHAQQAIEKSLKAWLCVLHVRFPLTHDLTDLIGRLQDHGQDVAGLWDLADFNPFAVEFRYTTLAASEPPLDRGVAITRVELLLATVLKLA